MAIVATVACVACGGAASVAPRATVYYQLDAPLCSSIIPAQFFIDGVQVGTETFRIDVAGGDHTLSKGYATSVGQHAIGARVTGGFVWLDRHVTLAAGAAFTDTLPFYCS